MPVQLLLELELNLLVQNMIELEFGQSRMYLDETTQCGCSKFGLMTDRCEPLIYILAKCRFSLACSLDGKVLGMIITIMEFLDQIYEIIYPIVASRSTSRLVTPHVTN